MNEPYTLPERARNAWWYRKYKTKAFFVEGIPRWVAMHLPQRLVLWCLVRVAAYASMGRRCGRTTPDQLTYPLMYQRFEEQTCD